MAYAFYNPNPKGNFTSDCVVRAISKLLDTDWDTTFVLLAMWAFDTKSIISSDEVWGEFLKGNGQITRNKSSMSSLGSLNELKSN